MNRPCNQWRRAAVKRAVLRWCGVAAAVASAASTGRALAAPSALDRAELASNQIQGGDFRQAAITIRQGLDSDPGESTLHALAATLLTITGDVRGAQSEWQVCLNQMPDDGLARYGSGLCYLASGNRGRALDQIQLSAQGNGDRAYCLLAERYVEALSGAGRAGDGLALPDSFRAGVMALAGWSAWQAGDHRKALSALQDALSALPGDPYSEPPGVVMMFDPARPIRYSASPLPTGNGLSNPRAAGERALCGVVTLSPGDDSGGIGFVLFRIDGGWSSVSNSPPFKLVWDTSRVPNGPHVLEIVIYDSQGRELSRDRREVRTANAGAPARQTPEARRAERIRSALWTVMMPRPSRAALCYLAAESARATGDMAAATRLMERAAAVDPEYRDVRVRLASLEAPATEGAIWRGGAGENLVALTFDDGPKPGITEQLLAVLAAQRVPATFFVIGRHVAAYPEIIGKLAAAGMEVENHTYTHPNLTLLPPAGVEREILRTAAAVRAATGKRTKYYRPPGGNFNAEVNRIAMQCGQAPCLWTIDGEALENGSPQRLIDYVVQKASPGAIILLHNGRRTTIEALPQIVAGLRKRGFQFATVEQLMERKHLAARQESRPVASGTPGG